MACKNGSQAPAPCLKTVQPVGDATGRRVGGVLFAAAVGVVVVFQNVREFRTVLFVWRVVQFRCCADDSFP